MDENHFSRRHLLKTGAVLIGASTPLLAMEYNDEVRILGHGAKPGFLGGRPRFSNWTGNINARPKSLATPTSLADIQLSISKASKVKAVGSGHSFSPCAHTDQLMIRTDGLNKILSIDSKRQLVKVEAGIKLADLNEQLFHLGFAIPSLGDVAVQGLAGAMATGTHGTGMQWGSVSDRELVHGMDIVLADGTLVELSEDRPEDHWPLKAARLGLGVLGFVYSVTLKLVPARNLELHSRLMDLEEALNPRHYQENDHFEYYHFPFTDKVQGIFRNITDQAARPNKIQNFFDKVVLENLVLGGVLNASSLRPSSMPRVMQTLTSLVSDQSTIDRSDKVMTSPRWVKFFEMEYAIPIAKAPYAHEILARITDEFANRGSDSFYANFPTEVRFIRGDKGNLLSPTQGEDCCYFAVMSHIAFSGYEPFFRQVEDAFLEIGGRPHWGKQFYRNPCSLYPEFQAFQTLKDNWDPDAKFSNIYWNRLVDGHEMLNEINA